MVVLHVLEVFLMTVMTVLLIRGEKSQNNHSIRSEQGWCGPPAVDLVTHCWVFVGFCRNMLMKLLKATWSQKYVKLIRLANVREAGCWTTFTSTPCLHPTFLHLPEPPVQPACEEPGLLCCAHPLAALMDLPVWLFIKFVTVKKELTELHHGKEETKMCKIWCA